MLGNSFFSNINKPPLVSLTSGYYNSDRFYYMELARCFCLLS